MRCEAQHLCSPARVFFLTFFLSRRGVSVAMISGTGYQKIIAQTQNKNIETEAVPFAFRFLIGRSVPSGKAQQKRYFCC